MARLIFVHGIEQQGKSSVSLTEEWREPLAAALAKASHASALPTPEVPFYGDILAELAGGGVAAAEAQGTSGANTGEAEFMAEGLEEIATRDARVDGNAIAAEAEDAAVEGQGLFVMDRRVNAIVRVLERISPIHGDLASRLLRQAWVYLRQPGAADRIDACVAPHFADGPAIVVAHSLGTIVTFKLLRRMALEGRPLDVPLLVTLGSPLSLRTVRKALGPSFSPPKGVGRWLNAYDPDDFVALGQGLTRATFAEGIENWGQVENSGADAHAISGYLSDATVVEAIGEALR